MDDGAGPLAPANLRETDAALQPREFIRDVAGFNANVLMMSAGGITALYPSQVEFGEVLR